MGEYAPLYFELLIKVSKLDRNVDLEKNIYREQTEPCLQNNTTFISVHSVVVIAASDNSLDRGD